MIGSLAELVSLPGMPSEPTLRKMIADNTDFPIVSRGKNGSAYEFDLEAAALFVRGLREKEEAEARARREEVRQFGLALLGDDAASDAAPGLSPAEQKAMLEAELAAIKVAEKRGQLVRRDSVEAALGEFLIWLGQHQATFMTRLAKRVDVPRDVIVAGERLMEADRRTIAARMERAKADAAPEGEGDAADPAVRDGLDDPGALGAAVSPAGAADRLPMG